MSDPQISSTTPRSLLSGLFGPKFLDDPEAISALLGSPSGPSSGNPGTQPSPGPSAASPGEAVANPAAISAGSAISGVIPKSFGDWASDPVNLAKVPKQVSGMPMPTMASASQPPPIDSAIAGAPGAGEPVSAVPPRLATSSPSPDPSAMPARPAGVLAPSGNSAIAGQTDPMQVARDYAALHSAVPLPPKQIGSTGKSFLGMSLATAMDDIGAALRHGTPTVGKNWLENLKAVQDYQRNLPVTQQQARDQAIATSLGQQGAAANITHTGAETANLALTSPFYQKAAELRQNLQQLWQSNSLREPDFDKAVALQLQGNPYGRMITPEVINQIKQLPRAEAGKVTLNDDLPTGVNVYGQTTPLAADKNGKPNGFIVNGKAVPFGDPSLPPELAQKVPEIQAQYGTHETKRGEKLYDEQTVAGFAASRQGAQINAAIQAANQAEANKTLNTGRGEALKHLTDIRDAQMKNQIVQQLAADPTPTNQTSLVFKMLDLDLPEGSHRINDSMISSIENQGSLSDRAKKALLNWTEGQQFAPDIVQDLTKTAQTITSNKIKKANDGLQDVNKVYGYAVPGSAANGRFDQAPTSSTQQPPPAGRISNNKKADPLGIR